MPSPASGAEREARGHLLAALGAVGAGTLLAQAALLRELLRAFQGNELSLGLAFAAWLTLTAIGSGVGGRLARAPAGARRALGAVLCAAPALLALSLWLTRLVRPAGLLAGQEPSLFASLPGALAALAPAGVLGGAAFALAVAALPAAEPGAAPEVGGPTRAYLAETLGAAAAGALFHFSLGERAGDPLVLGLAAAILAWAGATLLVRRRLAGALAGFAVAGVVMGATITLAPRAGAALERSRFPDAEIVASRPSRYGQLTVTRRAGQVAVYHDGVVLFTTEDQLAAEERVHLPLLLHPRPRRILLVGGAFGGGLAEALKHGPDRVDHVELDPALVEVARAHAGPADLAALRDPRVHTHVTDGRDLLRREAGAYDVILLDLPDPQSALLSRFWSRECFVDARRALAPGGLLAASVAASDSYLDGAPARKNAVLWRTLGAAFSQRGVAPGSRALVWAAGQPVDADPALLERRLEERHLALAHVGPGWLQDRLLPLNVDEYLAAVKGAGGRVNTDAQPVAYLYGLLEALQRSAPGLGRAALRVADAPGAPWLLLALLGAPALAVALGRRGRGAPGLAAVACGAAGMAVQLTVLLTFQALRGHLYLAVGGLAAAFMLGLAGGALLGARLAPRARGLALACGLATATAAAAPAVFAAAAAWPAASGPLLFALSALVGLGTGATFVPAVALLARQRPAAAAAARIYAFDLAGAAGAALGATILAVPLVGLPATAWAAAVLCGTAALGNLRAR
jgi:spermidine synthase